MILVMRQQGLYRINKITAAEILFVYICCVLSRVVDEWWVDYCHQYESYAYMNLMLVSLIRTNFFLLYNDVEFLVMGVSVV